MSKPSTFRYAARAVRDFARFARRERAFWLVPIALVVVLLGALVVASQSPFAPFIYTLF